MDSISSFINQYISGMANEGSCKKETFTENRTSRKYRIKR